MGKENVSKGLLYSQRHFDLLIKLYHTSFSGSDTLDDIYRVITESIVVGLEIDRAVFWRLEYDKMICIDLFDTNSNFHRVENDLFERDIPIYFKALRSGIGLVVNDALTNEYTQELKENYLIPLGINNMLDIPILENGKLIGVLCCENRDRTRIWNDRDLAFSRSIGDIFTTMLELYCRRVIEKKLIESERKLSLITQNSTDGFVIFEDRVVTYISPSYCKMLGYTEEEALQTTPEDVFNSIHPEDVDRVKEIMYGNLSRKAKNFTYSFRFKGKSDSYFWREDTASVIYHENGQYSKYIIISRDISDIKNAEMEIEKLYQLSKVQNEKLLDFTHIVSHNIRSNTSNMTMLINLLEDSVADTEKAEIIKLLKESNEKLSDTIYHLSETINVQLATKKQKTSLNVKSEIEKILKGINGIIRNEKAHIQLKIDSDIKITTIPSYFESIIFNLITNAIKYKSPNRDPVIEVAVTKSDGQFLFRIKDNGLGLDINKHKHKLFGMYKTFHGNENAVGLGLFMTKNHIEALGGTIDVTSEVGVGSTFKFILYD